MDELRGYYAKWNNPITERQVLHDSTYLRLSTVVKSENQRVQWWFLEGEERGNEGLLVTGHEVSVKQDE